MVKGKQPATPAAPAKAKRRGAQQPAPAVPVQPELRWQRTQRYTWDKGGSRGGRR
jgi:hypothetical protein